MTLGLFARSYVGIITVTTLNFYLPFLVMVYGSSRKKTLKYGNILVLMDSKASLLKLIINVLIPTFSKQKLITKT